ncbi:hypothetical protein Fmac_010478 [Flemingia macrophylla]|uniref:Uncharacterized protein n=1 Tax=Flemingia macrophylla TaxID=520843 RepID=A0ABD1MKF6_9FABA
MKKGVEEERKRVRLVKPPPIPNSASKSASFTSDSPPPTSSTPSRTTSPSATPAAPLRLPPHQRPPRPPSHSASLPLRRHRHAAEVTYLATDTLRLTGPLHFEVYHNDTLFLCGSHWPNPSSSSSPWAIDCHLAPASSAFFPPPLALSAPSVEVYVAGSCSGVPVILNKTILISPRRRLPRHATLHAIPEDDDDDDHSDNNRNAVDAFPTHRKLQEGIVDNRSCVYVRMYVPLGTSNLEQMSFRKLYTPPLVNELTESEVDDYDSDGKMGNGFYSQEMYPGEDGQLSWFNAGVRVGVGIGLGMCVGIGIGVGLLMRSYQTTTRNFRRRFF